MDDLGLAAVSLVLVAFALVSARAQKGIVTPPMVFVVFGLFADWTGLLDLNPQESVVHLLAEITLAIVLFIDAARIDLRRLFSEHNLPLRMLGIGMPLTIALGSVVAWALFPELGLAGAALLATILTPTDAALGQAMVTSPELPVRIRQALNVESGLNDGLALPFVVLFLSLAHLSFTQETGTPWPLYVLMQITLGPLVGVTVGVVGGKLLLRSCERGWISESFQGIASIGFALVAFAGAGLLKGNGFVAAFTAGLAFGYFARSVDRFLLEFGEAEGQLLVLGVFVIFGAAMVPEVIDHFDWRIGLFAILALTVNRMIPIRVSLAGSGLHQPSFWFLGWFGPRGLASIVFALLVAEQQRLPIADLILHVTVVTVFLSVFAHGMSAEPLSRQYGRTCSAQRDAFRAEQKEVSAMPTRYR